MFLTKSTRKCVHEYIWVHKNKNNIINNVDLFLMVYLLGNISTCFVVKEMLLISFYNFDNNS